MIRRPITRSWTVVLGFLSVVLLLAGYTWVSHRQHQVNPDDTVPTYVEVGYQQNSEVDFAWLIPIPAVIDAADVQTTSAELFNELEMLTAPRFTFQWQEVNYNYNYNGGSYGGYGYYGGYGDGAESSSGCGCSGDKSARDGVADSGNAFASYTTTGGGGGSMYTTTVEETIGVEVVAEAVVGPFDIQVITATDVTEFADWLNTNGYDMPANIAPLQHYVDLEMAYLGVKLAPDVPDGPIDTLVFTYPSTQPMIPIILTSIASAQDLPILSYILADEAWAPDNWVQAPDIAPDTLPDGFGGTTYLDNASALIDDSDGRAFLLEFSGLTSEIPTGIQGLDDLLGSKSWITRWRGDISPWQMTVDPVFIDDITLGAYSNDHFVELDFAPGETPQYRRSDRQRRRVPKGAWLLAPLPLLLLRRRRRH